MYCMHASIRSSAIVVAATSRVVKCIGFVGPYHLQKNFGAEGFSAPQDYHGRGFILLCNKPGGAGDLKLDSMSRCTAT